MSFVSVVIPSYNRAKLLARAIDSVLAQTLIPDEIIIVDDGSSDDTQTLIRNNYPEIIYIKQKNQGVSKARNHGITVARGKWIALLDSDDEWLPTKLEKQVNELRNNPVYKFAHTDEIWMRNGARVKQKKKHQKYGGHIFRNCLPLCAISPSSSIIHRSIFDELGSFNETLPACEDYDMWLRICARYPVLFINEPLIIKHGGHADQLSEKHWGMDRFRIQAIANILNDTALSAQDRNAAIQVMKKKIQIYLNGANKHQNMENVSEFQQLAAHYG